MKILKRILKYLHDVRIELKKVHWPTRRELVLFTGIVLVSVLVMGLLFWAMDTAFLAVLRLIIR